MRIALHIFRKDARRLWWEIAVTLGLLAALAHLDAHRDDVIPSPLEGMFNLLLPLAWAYLVALAVHEEAPVGDTQFWVTRPYPWPALVAAKALFVAAFVHLPSMLADAAIVRARGFPPLGCIPELASKQILLAGALTLPAAALATITKNVAQFIIGAIAISGAAVSLVALTDVSRRPRIEIEPTLGGIILVLLAGAGLAIVLLQYTRRRTGYSRALGLGAILAAGALFTVLPKQFCAMVRYALPTGEAGRHQVAIRLGSGKYRPAMPRQPQPNRESVAIPIVVAGMPEVTRVRWEPLTFELAGAHGFRWNTVVLARHWWPPASRGVSAGIGSDPSEALFLMMTLERSVWDRIKDDKVTVSGKFAGAMLRANPTVRLPLGGSMLRVPGAGRCVATMVSSPYLWEGSLKVGCESPAAFPLLTRVTLSETNGGEVWKHSLGDSGMYVSYPTQTWLSPMNRRLTHFVITDQPRTREEDKWQVPRRALANAVLEIVPERTAGYVLAEFHLPDLALGEYLIR
jgi:hypothetical protein